jgi:hypothetical protein
MLQQVLPLSGKLGGQLPQLRGLLDGSCNADVMRRDDLTPVATEHLCKNLTRATDWCLRMHGTAMPLISAGLQYLHGAADTPKESPPDGQGQTPRPAQQVYLCVNASCAGLEFRAVAQGPVLPACYDQAPTGR